MKALTYPVKGYYKKKIGNRTEPRSWLSFLQEIKENIIKDGRKAEIRKSGLRYTLYAE